MDSPVFESKALTSRAMHVANYRALASYLRTIGTLTLRLTFAEVEAITGKLPPSAARVRQWWENDPDKIQAREGWLAAGYETAAVSMTSRSLEFVRIAGEDAGGGAARRKRKRTPA